MEASFFESIGPSGRAAAFGLLSGILIIIVKYFFFTRRENAEADEISLNTYKKNLKKLIQKRDSRNLNDYFMDEMEFWEKIDSTRIKSKGNYQNQCGLIQDKFIALEIDDLLKFQGTYHKLIIDVFNPKIPAAFSIIINTVHFRDLNHFLDYLISKGQILFNNYTNNPELLFNENFEDIYTGGIESVLSDVYYSKTLKLIPEISDLDQMMEKINRESEKIDSRKIPDMFPKLWEKFF